MKRRLSTHRFGLFALAERLDRIWIAVYLQTGASAGARNKLIARLRRLGVTDVLFVGVAKATGHVRPLGPWAVQVDCPIGWVSLADEEALPPIRDPARLGVPRPRYSETAQRGPQLDAPARRSPSTPF